jgi:predicted dehydrogenase/threonine dehydrogenase-like Zn-dependent dehydrogenase
MKQLVNSLATGDIQFAEAPVPREAAGQVIVATRRTLISAGTERMLVDFGRAGWLAKARQQPDKVRDVLDKVRTDGVFPTLEAVRSKLDQPMPMGYSNVGVAQAVGAGVSGIRVGERVLSNGNHAEVVRVPHNLCARIPDAVGDDEAAFAVLGAIGLQGMRLAQPTLGECFVVTGLGLIGLLAVQMLRANGCRVLGLDFDRAKLDLAERFGAETVDLSAGSDPLPAAEAFSRGRGVDGVLLTAATQSSEPVSQAARMCRKRGRIVLVGVTGLELSRADFFEKELTFQVSCSYGPGRYDPAYEEAGHDYPVGFVRWTEQRNFEAVLDMMAAGTVDVKPLISHRLPFDRAPEAYDLLTSGAPSLGILLEYPERANGRVEPAERTVRMAPQSGAAAPAAGEPVASFIGAGNYASRVLVPAFRKAGARLRTVATSGGLSGVHVGRKYGFEEATTEAERVFDDPATNLVVVATPHDTHARFAIRALEAGKHVFVEKPLAIRHDELDRLEAAYRAACERGAAPLVMVGFNRRWAPHVVRARQLLNGVPGPKAFVMTVNAGAIPLTHWTQDPERGGGRIVGEGCHFVDLLRNLADAPITGWDCTPLRRGGEPVDDVSSFTLRFADGSHGTVHYLANGSKAFPKERLEVFAGGRVLQLDNYRRLRLYGWKGARGDRAFRQDKGNGACAAAFLHAVRTGRPSPIPFDEIMEVSRVSVALAEAARAG